MVRRFLEYWSIRDQAPAIELPSQPRGGTVFVPYVFSPAQVSAVLAATAKTQRGSRVISATTFRMFLLTLYATGGVFSEILRMRRSQVHSEECELVLSGDQRARMRRIPISPDLNRELKHYLDRTHASSDGDFSIFSSLDGKPLRRNYLIERFLRVLKVSEVARADGIRRSPRMQDFRATFAVHRLQAWHREKANLERLLPALSAYMGYASPPRFPPELHPALCVSSFPSLKEVRPGSLRSSDGAPSSVICAHSSVVSASLERKSSTWPTVSHPSQGRFVSQEESWFTPLVSFRRMEAKAKARISIGAVRPG